jgi:hypothetical protein
MRICQDHWDKLRGALKERGIDHLGAQSGVELMENIKTTFDGGQPNYDPLIDCNNMIWSRGLEMGGLYLMNTKEDGSSYCPICEAIVYQPSYTREDHERYWIDGPADAALAHCRMLGLIPAVQ